MKNFIITMLFTSLFYTIYGQKHFSLIAGVNYPVKLTSEPTFRKLGFDIGLGLDRYNGKSSYETNFIINIWPRINYPIEYADWLTGETVVLHNTFISSDFSLSFNFGRKINNRIEIKNGLALRLSNALKWNKESVIIDPELEDGNAFDEDKYLILALDYCLRIKYVTHTSLYPFLNLRTRLFDGLGETKNNLLNYGVISLGVVYEFDRR